MATGTKKQLAKNPRFKAGKPKVPLDVEPRLSDFEVFRDLNRGLSLSQVAKSHKISWATARAIHDRMTEYFRREFWTDIVRIKSDHSAKLMDIYCEARQAFESSKEPTVQETESAKNGSSTKTTTSSGDPRFLESSRAALADIRKIWGADAPIQLEHSEDIRVAGKTKEQVNQELREHIESLLTRLAK